MQPTIADLLERSCDGKLPHYGWPGGYPILYVDKHNSILCPDCAQEALSDEFEDFRPCAWHIHYEGPSDFCSECNKEVESAYGNPWEDDD